MTDPECKSGVMLSCCAVMHLVELTRIAVGMRARYATLEISRGGAPWSRAELAQGFVGDVGALMKLVMAREGRREAPADLDAQLEHELADCLWSVLVLAEAYGVDLERAFATTMHGLEKKLTTQAGEPLA
jgi:NTP pyrophosphatase (non-canonical NTP hydrolase)